MRYEEIYIEWTPAELDRFLQENYGYSLWHFSWSFIHNSFLWKDYREGSGIKILKEMKNKLQKISEQLIKPPFPYKAHKDINNANKEIDWILNSQNTKGAPSKRLSIIALIWSYFIRKGNEIHFANITGLLEWFIDRNKNCEFFISFFTDFADPDKPCLKNIYEDEDLTLTEQSFNNEKFRKLIYRHRKENTHSEAVEEGKRVFKLSIINSISFENKGAVTKKIEKIDWEKNTPLITFPNSEILTVGDFEQNSERGRKPRLCQN